MERRRRDQVRNSKPIASASIGCSWLSHLCVVQMANLKDVVSARPEAGFGDRGQIDRYLPRIDSRHRGN
jgi:hypothetical protein